ncbi:MAG: hypothetical protein CVV42_17895 [Candidatus Riflebacteria bacterium HGW-Riflebacteria-2]|jgi:hypothetical protein|nr:MAG: hypothetical protein CVV42_17895 [Candidatus Riflebacteria bacterium HGW-Riflebacteria-2]
MWTIVQVGVCLVFLVLAAFFIGRKLGQRRFYQIQEEMRALELSFKNLMEDMEMVSAHNMKVLETRTEEIKELMTIADRKCIYVNDLLKEMDETSASLRMRNIGGSPAVTSIEAGAGRKAHKEMQGSLDSLLTRVSDLSGRIGELEDNQTVFEQGDFVDLVRLEVAKQLRVLAPDTVPAKKETVRAESQAVTTVIEHANERVVPMRQPVRENFADSTRVAELSAAARPKSAKGLKIASIDDGARLPAMPKKTDLAVETAFPRPAAGFAVSEVLALYENGVTLPQIARTLNMSKSEIELILKIYGEGINMRKIV